jgi:TolA-binding protein
MTNSSRKFLLAVFPLALSVAGLPAAALAQAQPAKPAAIARPAAAARPAAPTPVAQPRPVILNTTSHQQQFQQQVNQQQVQNSQRQQSVRQQIRQNNVDTQRTNATDPALRTQLDANEATRRNLAQPQPMNTAVQPARPSSSSP